MDGERLYAVVSMPAGLHEALGDAQVRRLASANPRAEVALVGDPARFAEPLPRADAALVWPTMAPLLAPAPRAGGRLRWVHNLPAGVEGTLTPAVRAAGRVVFTASEGPIGPMMAEHALLVLLALACDLPGFLRDQAARRWRFLADERPTVDVFGKTVLILGVGVVGGHLARMCRVGLGMCVLGLARGPSCPPRSARPTSSRCASPWPPRRRGSSTRRRWRRCARTPP